MKRRGVLLVLSFVGLALVAVLVYCLLPPGPGVTRANFDRLDDGMSLAQVEALLGPREAAADLDSLGFAEPTRLMPRGHTREV